MYQKVEEQLKKEEDKVRRFETQMGNYEELRNVKVRYLALTKECEEVVNEKERVEGQNAKLEETLQNLSK